MTKISILPIPTDRGDLSYHAIAGKTYALGKTAGEALDALTEQLSEDDTSTLVIMQSLRPDPFFTAAQQERLMVLMARWRNARDQGNTLPIDEQTELVKLVEAELHASTDRVATLTDMLRQFPLNTPTYPSTKSEDKTPL